MVSINSDEGVLEVNLLFSNLAHVLNGVVSRVLSKGQGDLLKSLRESAHCVLLNSTDFIGLLGNSDGAGKLSGTTSANDVVVLNHVAHNTDGVMKAPLGLVTDGSGATSDHDGNSL